VPVACPTPSSRCLGGQRSPCATGYTGTQCSLCASGYEDTPSNPACTPCSSAGCGKIQQDAYGYQLNGGQVASIAFAYIIGASILITVGYFVYRRYSKKNTAKRASIIDAYEGEVSSIELNEGSSRPASNAPFKAQSASTRDEASQSKQEEAASAAPTAAALNTNSPPPPEYVAAPSQPAPVKQVPFDFFKPRDRMLRKEVEGATLYRTFTYMKTKSPHYQKIEETGYADLILARIGKLMYDKVAENLSTVNIFDMSGNPSRFYDGFEIQALVDIEADKIAVDVLGSFTPPLKSSPNLTFQHAEDQGPRPKMEDKWVAIPDAQELLGLPAQSRISIFSVYDGHGGPIVAEYIAKHLHINILRDEYFKKSIRDAIREGFLSTNELFFQYANREVIGDNVGSTAVFTMIKDKKLWIAWAGDSEACIYRKNGDFMQICATHKPWVPKEKARIEQMGGTVEERGGLMRVCGSLAVSRAFGDAKFRQFITAEPDTVCLDLKGDEEFLVVACDGLWDVMNAQAVGTYLSQYSGGDKQGMTEALIMHARALGSTDNITAVVVVFE